MTTTTNEQAVTDEASTKVQANLVRPDTALRSFRDGGYTFNDAVGEIVDNSIQGGATEIWIDWTMADSSSDLKSFAVFDNGKGIPYKILANTLTVGFSTRYGDRQGIGRFGVGFKLGSLSQAKRLEVYTRPAYTDARAQKNEEGHERYTFKNRNDDGRVFRTYLDMDEVEEGKQQYYEAEEVDDFPKEFRHLAEGSEHGTLIVWRKLDRLNEERAYAKNAQEKLQQLIPFLRRVYREYIHSGIKIYIKGDDEPLYPYDPQFQISNPHAERLANGCDMTGEFVENGTIEIDGETVKWSVYLTPEVTRLEEGGGGVAGPDHPKQFKKLYIPDNEGKLSFLRHSREISYTIVPKLLPGGVHKLDRYIGMTVRFPPALDEYFQVKHIKRGVEPVDKFRQQLRQELKKPVKAARRRIRKLWREEKKKETANEKDPDDFSGGRQLSEAVAQMVSDRLPLGRAGMDISPEEEEEYLKRAAADVGITDQEQMNRFVENLRQKPIAAIDTGWPGKGLLEIEHLNKTVVVRINRRHPLIEKLYMPIREALADGPEAFTKYDLMDLLEKGRDAVDLLLFAYAKSENLSQDPDKDYGGLREFWGQFLGIYVKKREDAKSE